jgi:Ca2+-binding RTX toxin-like protein
MDDSGKANVIIGSLDYVADGVASYNISVETFYIYLGPGDDTLDATATSSAVYAYGGEGTDTIKGGSGNDQLNGQGGNDTIYGNDGNDWIRGDYVFAGASNGNDTLDGGIGHDTLWGDDEWDGGTGNDILVGGGGEDRFHAHGGDDQIVVGDASFAEVSASSGYDRLIFAGLGMTLNLVTSPSNRVQGTEEIDLAGSGDHRLILNQASVLSASDTTDTLIVKGGHEDLVDKGTGWTFAGTETISGQLYKNFTQGAALLKIQQATQTTPRREALLYSDSLDAANPAGFTGSFTIESVQGYQGLGPVGNIFNASFLKSSSSATLTLTNLPEHDSIDLRFLLAIIDSWDGKYGDYFNVLVDGVQVFRETFSVFSLTNQSYAAQSGGLLSFGSQLGFDFWSDAAYNMAVEPGLWFLPHSASTLTLQWLADGSNWEGGTSESWAIDNLSIGLWEDTFTIPDNLAANAYVADMASRSIDPSSQFTYSLVSGTGDTDNGYFAMVGNELRTATALLAGKTSYSIRVRATDQDGVQFETVMLILASTGNQAPTDLNLSPQSLAEMAGANAIVGTFTTIDPNPTDTFTYTLVSGTGDQDNGQFEIVGDTLKAKNSFDYETKSSYSIRVRTTDQGSLYEEKVFSILVTDVNEAPTDISISPSGVNENAGTNATVGTFSSVDEPGNTFTYTFATGGTDNSLFSITGATLKANDSFDFEQKSSYSIRVRSTDQGGLWFEKDLTIQVNDVDENVYLNGSASPNDLFIATYTGNGTTAQWSVTRNGVNVFTGTVLNGGALVFDGQAGTDTLNVVGRTVDDLFVLQGSRVTLNNAIVQHSNVETFRLLAGTGSDRMIVHSGSAIFDGGGGIDTVEAPSGSNTWSVTAAGTGSLNGTLQFLQVESLQGGDGADQFSFGLTGSLTGQVAGGAGTDTLNFSAKTTALTINLQTSTATSTGGFLQMESFVGGAATTDTVIGANTVNAWAITGNNSGTVNTSTSFSGFENLTGGTSADTFTFAAGGSLTGNAVGGSGIDQLDLSAKSGTLEFRLGAVNRVTGVTGYTTIETVTGNGVAGSAVVGANVATTWVATAAGQIVVGGATYSGVSTINGGTANDLLLGPNVVNSWNVSGADSGSLNSGTSPISFTGVENLTGGTLADTFTFAAGGSLTGNAVGGSGIDQLDLSAKSGALEFRLGAVNRVTGVTGYTTIETVTGNGVAGSAVVGSNVATNWVATATGQIVVGGATYSGVSTINGGTANDLLLGPNVVNSWNVSGADSGSLNSGTSPISFTGVENLAGGTLADTFTFAAGGSLTGNAVGGSGIDQLDLSAKSGALEFRLGAVNRVTGVTGYTTIETVTGNGVAGSAVVGSNVATNWVATAAGQIVVGGATYSGVPAITGGTALDTLTGPNVAATWTISGNNSGSLNTGSATVDFTGVENLTGGTNSDTFLILPAGTLSGNLNGGTGSLLNSLIYSTWTTSVVVNLSMTTAGNATGITNLTSNIQLVTGGSGSDTLTGQASRTTVLVGLGGSDTLTGGSQRDLLFGGLGSDIILGNSSDDILVSGRTSHDEDILALWAIYAEWTSTRTFAQRTANLWGNGIGSSANGTTFLNNDSADAITDTVFADIDADTLTGGLNQDWFIADLAEITDFTAGGANPDRRN